ncbi:hypothetical protein CROQUDRAFT_60699 [Cronartium quercuum f. sp. fusiforme G11]|uniref:SCP domain-containing protein n=1 Tax=Cronartium quercuum f. sp. fusiforme G11 TaxID=708437 RepID=A0A9P6TF16_9BASI|nr:hypothetical protein CROQUDRAFT_60699 [Cronartium quercuum f. sp. fusiforme G11]
MTFPFKITVFILVGCQIFPFRATSRALSSVHKSKESRGQKQIKNQYSWEAAWHSETVDGVTTITSVTAGCVVPGQAIPQVASSVWSYTYRYTESSIKNSTSNSGIESLENDSLGLAAASPANLSNMATDEPPSNIQSSPPLRSPGPSNTSQTQSPPDVQDLSDSSDSPDGAVPTPTLSSPPPPQSAQGPPDRPEDIEPARRPLNEKALNPLRSVANATKFVTQAGDVDNWLTMHNTYRYEYGSPSLVWNSTLADQARKVASTCHWQHTANNPSGENLAAGQETAEDCTQAWMEGPDERDGYDPSNPTYSHFTQVVWKETTQVGCWTITCKNIEGTALPQSPVKFFVCEYFPKGNIVGSFAENVRAAKGGQPLGGRSPNRSDSQETSVYQEAPTGPPTDVSPPGK